MTQILRTRPTRDDWLAHPPRATVRPRLRPWLLDPGSLTARIRARCERFEVRVVRQAPMRPHPDEAELLGLRPGARAWLREVLLLADGVPVVYARSVLPRHNLRGAWRLFHGIGSRPLGAALFSDPRIVRQPLRCTRLDVRDARYHRAMHLISGQLRLPASLWARRSLFRLRGRALLVSEVFLPTILTLAP
ncbi:chorismate--pyruvate lyase family protein [Denitromonas iodatirespirans]|uniref:Probable chorismate pyruvate-lyase n=1 Tax=Denitromonas iodatirespirans TaxID=2795389 RepID=A0A944DCY7_DENI1|nr:chorismate lyase [Denitromonas iodatirespirans]MBT0962781.1 chorismate lyase [Denitromonas iodatirespirans]